MLQTRLWMGSLLALLTIGVLFADQHLKQWHYPFLFGFMLSIALVAGHELWHLLPSPRPASWFCILSLVALLVSNWLGLLLGTSAWPWILGAFAAVIMSSFLLEMATYQAPGQSIVRMAMATWLVGYLGVLPCFFAQLRWLPEGTQALALAIFVPKGCDIGAYFIGRMLGKHKMSPKLSPGKTWEGGVGGLGVAVLVAVLLGRLGPALGDSTTRAVGFGVTVGLAGILGDLAESLIKRDGRQKDASQFVPGFGGVLDVVDAVIFAAPVSYAWLAWPV